MFLRFNRRFKDGKEHRYWNIVESKRCAGGRVVQRQVLYLGEINDSQQRDWCRAIEVFDDAPAIPLLLAAAVISLVQFAIRVRISWNELYGFVNKYGLSVVVYALVGGTSALVEWFSFLMLQRNIHAIAAACIAFVIATSINYILSRRTAFKSTLPWQQEIAKLFALSAVAFAGNLGSFTLLYAIGVDILLAKILGTGVGFILNYAFRQFAVFSHEPRFKPIFRSKNVARSLTI